MAYQISQIKDSELCSQEKTVVFNYGGYGFMCECSFIISGKQPPSKNN